MAFIGQMAGRLRRTWLFPRYIGVVYIEPAMKKARPYAQGTLLDIGCGTRRYEPIFTGQVEKYVGLDWPEFDRARPDVIGDAMNLPVGSASVDTVLATELMEHLPWPQQFLQEVRRVLRSPGALILSVPFMEPLHEEPRDFYRFTPYSLRVLLAAHGFTVEHIWPKGGWWSVVLGSFVNQALYDWASPQDVHGQRRYSILTALVLPLCTAAQLLGYALDKVFASSRYTLGYVVVARLQRGPA
jgi:SAM-dependent methyltransferase